MRIALICNKGNNIDNIFIILDKMYYKSKNMYM